MQAMERCLSTRGNENTTAKPSILYKGTANSYLRNNTIRGVARDLGDVADSSSVVPQKLFNYDDGNAGSFGPSDMNHLANPCPVNTKTESTPAARTHSLKPYTFVAIDPNNRWKRYFGKTSKFGTVIPQFLSKMNVPSRIPVYIINLQIFPGEIPVRKFIMKPI